MGDSGVGKSMVIRHLLYQIQARGESAIIHDSALEFTPEFYDPARGDIILNPLDARMPYWSPSDEVQHPAEAHTIATSLYPGRHDETPDQEFFTKTPRQIFAHLRSLRAGPDEFALWMRYDEELERRLAVTSYAKFVDRKSANQRNGVLGSLNLVATALMLLPTEAESTTRWSAATWAQERRGWIFLTSTPATREGIRPLTSLWLDTLVLRLMSGEPGPQPTWFILDELASLQRLPQLHTAVTENRKSNNPLVLGFQGRSQLETRYGHDAEAMLAQPATKIFLRTGEAHAAKWIADTIGQVEIERLVESRATTGDRQQTILMRQPLVADSEITGLENLRGVLKIGNRVVRLEILYRKPVKRILKFLARPGVERLASGELPLPAASAGDAPELGLGPQGTLWK
jgi:type IV secretory pathway TraG/TraD family ATPase VirD4